MCDDFIFGTDMLNEQKRPKFEQKNFYNEENSNIYMLIKNDTANMILFVSRFWILYQ